MANSRTILGTDRPVVMAACVRWLKSNTGGGGGGGQMTSGARKSRPRDAADPGPANGPSGRSSKPKCTEPCGVGGGGTTPHEVGLATTGEGRWNDDRSCLTVGASPQPMHATHKSFEHH